MFKLILAFALICTCVPMTVQAQHHNGGYHVHHHYGGGYVAPRPIYAIYAPRPIYVVPRPYYGPSLYLNFGTTYPTYQPYPYGYLYSY